MSEDRLVFADDANEEHAAILRAKSGTAASSWELGARLLRFRETGEWQKVTVGGPYQNFADYLIRGCRVSVTTGYRYMAAAWFPKLAALKHGTDALALLKSIIDMTADDESVEEALALELPTESGGGKPFGEMTLRELEQALPIIRAAEGARAPAGRPFHRADSELERLRDRLREAASPWIKPRQISARLVGGHEVVDLKAVPLEKLREVLEALVARLRVG
ncbi:MAG: hypothetical protein ACYC8T_10100 [Myxococcaceae bacterium]